MREYFDRILSFLREDHQKIFLFAFSFFYLKSCGQFNDFEWKIFIDGEVITQEDQKLFQNHNNLLRFKGIKTAISLISSASYDYMLPLIPYNMRIF